MTESSRAKAGVGPMARGVLCATCLRKKSSSSPGKSLGVEQVLSR